MRYREAVQGSNFSPAGKCVVGDVGSVHRLLRCEGGDGVDFRVDTLYLHKVVSRIARAESCFERTRRTSSVAFIK